MSALYTIRCLSSAVHPETFISADSLERAQSRFVMTRSPLLLVKSEEGKDEVGTEWRKVTLGDGTSYVIFKTHIDELKYWLGDMRAADSVGR